jgi:asparagine synthase (glutamine-hydrolysing)
MHNRGPDASGIVQYRPNESAQSILGLGSARLAVLDVTQNARQPMSSVDTRFTLVYNGEVTNYLEIRDELRALGRVFTSGSDTEVVLQAWQQWGQDAVPRFDGMFAFAILDRSERHLSLCRDAFGIKPLFYAQPTDTSLVFSSEIPSILRLLPGRPLLDRQVAARYLSSGICDVAPDSFVAGVRQLLPGTALHLDLDTGRCTWQEATWVPAIRTRSDLSFADACEGVRSQLIDSVRRNLRADRPVGFALSGGIDSSAIVCAARAVEPDYPMRTFSYRSFDPAFDESRWASAVAAYAGAELAMVTPTANDMVRDLDDLIRSQGEPFGSTSIYAQYCVFRLMHEHGVVVSLDGQGGDEVFAGYQGFVGERTWSLIETGHPVDSISFLRSWTQWPGRSWPKAAARVAMEGSPVFRDALTSRHPRFSIPGVRRDILRGHQIPWGWWPPKPDRDGLRGVRLKAELRAELTRRGLQEHLRNGDRNSMRFSVESRVPFLDKSLVEFVLSFPEQWLVDDAGTTKAVLRTALRGLVPEEVLRRRDKVGFEGDDGWMTALRPVLLAQIAEGPEIDFIDKRAFLQAAMSPTVPNAQVWRMYCLYRWMTLLGVQSGD